ncbi:hypothetical protein EGH82_23280 [Vibrio ponticus]|uniref:Uncharacterized protein n=1 Tax=Vibrio ponticus TaxID=265668 RepID=A0A3N3DQY3_9VIBR|nr:hypothetical protein [Vibrio ponticus]ROV56885.1 hypothetical protein EGH82_23280 [Vibrio ponticus]
MKTLQIITISGERKNYNINEEVLNGYNEARSTLSDALDFEVLYDQLMEAYWDYKNKVNYWNIRSVSKPMFDYVLNHEIRSTLNRFAFNLLNLGKMYLDKHFNRDKNLCFASGISGHKNDFYKVEAHRHEIFESNVEYVIGCKLRGHVQHKEMPVSSFSSGVKNNSDNTRISTFDIKYNRQDLINMKVPVKRISKDSGFELTSIFDGYVDAISKMHHLNRELTESKVKQTRNKLSNYWCKYTDELEEKILDCIYFDNQKINTSLEWFVVYDYLNKKHAFPVEYSTLSFEK